MFWSILNIFYVYFYLLFLEVVKYLDDIYFLYNWCFD